MVNRIRTRQPKTHKISGSINLSEKNHEKLLQYLKDRLLFGKQSRDRQIDRYRAIDRQIAAYLRLTQDEKKRQQDVTLGKSTATHDFILPLVEATLDEYITYMMSVLAPDEGIYPVVGPADQQDTIKGFSALMEKQNKDFGHYVQLIKGTLDQGKYNIGGWLVEWAEVLGNKIKNSPSGTDPVVEQGTIRAGNELTAVDPYNFLYDNSVDPFKLHSHGEFFAIVDAIAPFQIRRMVADRKIYGSDRYLQDDSIRGTSAEGAFVYYEQKPRITNYPGNSDTTDWVGVLSAGVKREVVGASEVIDQYIWIVPSDFGLSNVKDFQIWRFKILNDMWIVEAAHLTNAHSWLPIALGTPKVDGFKADTPAYSENLMPLQRFASNELNVRQKSARKKLYGLTIYDQQFAPLMEKADILGGKVPWRGVGQDRDIRKAFLQLNDAPITDDTLENVQGSIDLMQKILPTDILRQVAGLERATTYQAAAVVQGGNRRLQKIAKVVNFQAWVPAKMMMYYNILQFQPQIDIISPQGERIKVDPLQFREADIEFMIASGLAGIDRLLMVEMLRDIINVIIQSQFANQQVDIVKLLDYWTDIIGDKTDFSMFKIQSQFDTLPPDQKDLAFQLLQQALQTQGGDQGGGNQQPQLPAPGNGAGGPVTIRGASSV